MTESPAPLPPESLRRRCRLDGPPRPPEAGLPETGEAASGPGAEAPPPAGEALGQARAVEAAALAADMRGPGYNLFVMSPHPAAAARVVRRMLEARAAQAPRPSDWVYVNDFDAPARPVAIEMPAGRASAFRREMVELIEELRASLPAMFESEDYRARREAIDDETQSRQQEAFEALAERARARGAAIVRTPMGFVVAVLKDDEIVTPEAFRKLPKEEQETYRKATEEIQEELQAVMRTLPKHEKDRREAVRELDRETARMAVGQSIEEVTARFADLPKVQAHLERVRHDLVEHAALFLADRPEGAGPPQAGGARFDARFDAFSVNALVAAEDGTPGAPVVVEDHPTLMNLIGRVEHVAQQGALVTNFTLIRPGALHRANGGFLVLEARQLLSEPFAWAALKRALRAGCIRIASPSEYLGFAATVTLEPDPIPLDLKVVILGERLHYYLLLAYDPEMRELFKVAADFEDAADWTGENAAALAAALAGIAAREGLHPLSQGAAEALVEHAARLAEDARRLALDFDRLSDRLREADHFAARAGRAEIAREDAGEAVAAERRRVGRIREQAQEMILRDLAVIDVTGRAVGQVNGLSVSRIGDLQFGRPARITARARLGGGEVVDIEREAKLGGPIHSKGVLILSAFLSARYARETPVSLSASLVFEQSYGGVDGDSASCAELCALLSELAEAPLRQDLAITGSVDQHGRVQAIGGVNDKIEGFFDICAARGLTGRQGVLIPAANVQHLMLREDVAQACAEGRFAVHALETADQALALLTGEAAGARGPDGRFPPDSVNGRVEARLSGFARRRRAFGRPETDADGVGGGKAEPEADAPPPPGGDDV